MFESNHNTMPAWRIRRGLVADLPFIFSLAPRLSGVPRPGWHDLASMEAFQERFMQATLNPPSFGAATFIFESASSHPVGYIHVEPGKDSITNEPCGYVALLAVTVEAEGKGVASALLAAAETWAVEQGYRLLSLDVFATNEHAGKFYERAGFKPETNRLVKVL